MAFIILGSVGSALASGLAAVGLGTVGAAGAAGTGLAGAIGSAAGAASGIGAGISGGIASGLGALGMGTAAAPSALASAIGTGATTAAGGAGLGAATSAATGGDPGQGALFGALGGAVTGGLGSALGGTGGGAGSAVGEAAKNAGLTSDVLSGAVPASPGVGISGSTVTAPTASGSLSSATLPSGSSSMFGELGSDLMKEGAQQGMDMMKPEDKQARPPERIAAGRPRSPYSFGGDKDSPLSNPFAHFAEGGLTTLKGGGIAMRDGQYVIPADVVSAIGNGSSKAGAKFLEAAFNHYIQNGPPEGLQAPQRAGSLAEQRAIERMNRKPV